MPSLDAFLTGLRRRNPSEAEFHQAVAEVALDLIPFIAAAPRYQDKLTRIIDMKSTGLVDFKANYEEYLRSQGIYE